MAAPTFQFAASDKVFDTSDTSLVVTTSGGGTITAGDRLIAIAGCATGLSVSAPGGWTTEQNDTNGTYRIYVFTKVASSGDAAAANFTFTVSGGFSNGIVAVLGFSGASTNALTAGFSTGANSQSQTAPTITTPSNDCIVLWGWASSANSTTTADKGTERIDTQQATPAVGMAVYTDPVATAASTTGAVLTTSGFGAKRVFSLALEAAGGGGGSVGMINLMPRRQRTSRAILRM